MVSEIRSLGLAALMVASLVSTAPATADEGTAGATSRVAARDLMVEGRARKKAGDLEGALDRFRAADALVHAPTTAFATASAEADLGHLLEAKARLDRLLEAPAPSHEPPAFAAARENARKLRSALERRVPTLAVEVSGLSLASAATVSLDGAPLAAVQVGEARAVNPGKHVAVVDLGGRQATQEVTVREGEAQTVRLELPPPIATPEPAAAPAAVLEPEPPTTRSSSAKAVAIAGFGIAGAGVLAGSIAGVASLALRSSLDEQCPNKTCGPDHQGDLAAASTAATVANVSFAVALTGALVGIAGLVAGHDDESRPSVTPVVGAGSLGLKGRF